MRPRSVKARVAAGVAFLDREGPVSWRARIDCERLDLGRCDRCILGQIFGDYGAGLRELAPVEDDSSFPIGYGFERTAIELRSGMVLGQAKRQYEVLTAAWREALDCDGEEGVIA